MPYNISQDVTLVLTNRKIEVKYSPVRNKKDVKKWCQDNQKWDCCQAEQKVFVALF